MVSLEEPHQTPPSKCAAAAAATATAEVDPTICSPRISFSSEFLDENNFISICPGRRPTAPPAARSAAEFEFLSGNLTNMMSADELFREGKLLPFRQTTEKKLNNITTTSSRTAAATGPPEDQDTAAAAWRKNDDDVERRISWFLDDDPSPRPPKCTVLWKELLNLKKQRGASTLSPSSSSSSSSSTEERKKEKVVNRVKKGLERTRSASIRIRPMVNVPICSQGKNSSLPPLFSFRRGRLD